MNVVTIILGLLNIIWMVLFLLMTKQCSIAQSNVQKAINAAKEAQDGWDRALKVIQEFTNRA